MVPDRLTHGPGKHPPTWESVRYLSLDQRKRREKILFIPSPQKKSALKLTMMLSARYFNSDVTVYIRIWQPALLSINTQGNDDECGGSFFFLLLLFIPALFFSSLPSS